MQNGPQTAPEGRLARIEAKVDALLQHSGLQDTSPDPADVIGLVGAPKNLVLSAEEINGTFDPCFRRFLLSIL